MKWLNNYRIRLFLAVFMAVSVLGDKYAKADFTFGEPTILGAPVSIDSYGDFANCLSSDGLQLYFMSNRPQEGNEFFDLWVTRRQTRSDPWGEPEPVTLGPAVESGGAWEPSISSDGLEFYFCSDRPGGYGQDDIWVMTRATQQDAWGEPVNLGAGVNSSTHDSRPSISASGLELYFCSGWIPSQSNGYTYEDLYVVKRSSKDEPWGERINLGPVVNSSNQDGRPSVSADGLVLFFDSQRDGRPPYGELYMTRRASLSDPWETPINLGSEINTSDFEQGALISPDGSTLFFWRGIVSSPAILSDTDIWQAPIIPIVDFNGDSQVDIDDLIILIEHWGQDDPAYDMGPMPWGDGMIDASDLDVLMSYWGQEVYGPHLLAHWKLDEGEGDVAYDSAAENDAVVTGDPVWQPDGGQVNGALEFDGVDDFISAPTVINPSDGPFSILTWIKGGAIEQAIVSEAGGSDWLSIDALTGSLMTELTQSGRGSAPLFSETAIVDNNWHRVGFTWDGFYRTLYVDDVIVAQDTQNGLQSPGNTLYIGCGDPMQPNSFFSGLIDDVRIYNRAVHP